MPASDREKKSSAAVQHSAAQQQVVSCEHGERCGGCAYLGLPLAEQLSKKRALVGTALGRHASLEAIDVAEVAATDELTSYRTRAKLVVSAGAAGAAVGLYARGTHDVVDIPACRVMAPPVAATVAALRARLARPAADGGGARDVTGAVTGLDVREVISGGSTRRSGVLVTLIGASGVQTRDALSALARQVSHFPGVLGVAISLQKPGSAQLLGGAPELIAGAGMLPDTVSVTGPYHYATHGSFVQAHRGQAAAIQARVLDLLQRNVGGLRGARVLELYAGSGALGLALRAAGARPVLVERYEPALALLQRAAEEQQLSGIATRAGDAEQVLAELVQAGEHFDAVVVNPPRRGLTPRVRALVVQLAPRALVYVSCEPETLARDLADLAQRGYATERVQPFDLMPLSEDVESVVALLPASPARVPVLHETPHWLAVNKPPHLPTIPQGEQAQSLLELLRAQLGVKELFAVHRLDLGTSGVCLFAKDAATVPQLSAALAAGQKYYTALVRGVAHKKGIIKTPLRDGGKTRDALTRYTRSAVIAGHSLLHVRPEHGRMHQVRKHLASIRHPVLGDARYGEPKSNLHFEHRFGLDRTFLHLERVELQLAGPEQPALLLEAPLPGDLRSVLSWLAPR